MEGRCSGTLISSSNGPRASSPECESIGGHRIRPHHLLPALPVVFCDGAALPRCPCLLTLRRADGRRVFPAFSRAACAFCRAVPVLTLPRPCPGPSPAFSCTARLLLCCASSLCNEGCHHGAGGIRGGGHRRQREVRAADQRRDASAAHKRPPCPNPCRKAVVEGSRVGNSMDSGLSLSLQRN